MSSTYSTTNAIPRSHVTIPTPPPPFLILIHPPTKQPHLPNLPNLLPQHRPPIPIRDLPGRLHHPARTDPHQRHDLQRTHPALLALATLRRQHLQEGLVDIKLHAGERRALGVRAGGGVRDVLFLGDQDALEDVVGLEFAELVDIVGGVLGVGFGGGGERDLEVEFGEEGAGEVGVLVAALEDDAVEFVVGDGDGEVGLGFAAGG